MPSSMGEAIVKEAISLCLQTSSIQEDVSNTELAFLQVARDYEATRMKWLHAELELKKCRELLSKSDLVRSALEVQLKHARNQVDVEIKKRHRAETDYEYLERQIKSICDILISDSKTSACLSDEQRSMLADFNHKQLAVPQQRERRLTVIDESSFYSHSDISYDRTDDDLDLDTAVLKPLKSRAKEKRRSSIGPNVRTQRRSRYGRSGDFLGARSTEKIQEVETTVVRASVSTPESGSSIQLVIDIAQEPVENPSQSHIYERFPSVIDQTSVWAPPSESKIDASTVAELEVTSTEPSQPVDLTPTEDRTARHVFLSKTVIRPELCVPCGKRIRFGKMLLKCRDCRIITHPECKHRCNEPCSAGANRNPQPTEEPTLESFAPFAHPRIPLIITQCVNEIEKRGLRERGIYRVPGGERVVKELKERYLGGKGPLLLNKVGDIHVVCGLLKDFLRKLKEPLITFRLHEKFIKASEIAEDDYSATMMCQAIEELPAVNRNTLAFLMLHLQRVMRSPLCQMDLNNLARVFGPTIVGHSMPEPAPMTIMRDTNSQPKVMAKLLSFSAEYWNGLLRNEQRVALTPDNMFTPLRTPELGSCSKTPSTSSLSTTSLKGKIRTFGNAFTSASKPRSEPRKNFFTSPK